MTKDPIVEEVHQARAKLLEQCGGDFKKLVAYLREWDATANDWETDTAQTFTVWDDIGDRYGDGRDDAGSGGRGKYGKAEYESGSERWLIYDLECP